MEPSIRVPLSDHDLLITLNTKFDQLSIDVKSMSDGVAQKLADHDLHIRAIEKLHDEMNPIETQKQIKANSQWIHDFDTRFKLVVAIIIAFSTAVSFLMTNIYHALPFFK